MALGTQDPGTFTSGSIESGNIRLWEHQVLGTQNPGTYGPAIEVLNILNIKYN